MNPEDSIATLLKLNGFGFNGLDVFAFVWFLACTVGFTLLVRWTGIEQRGLVGAIHEQRVRWLSNMAHRNDRVIDTLLMSSVASGHTFFASTSVILMGALATLLGAGDKVGAILGRLPFAAPVSPVAWDFKVLLLMAVFVYAFFKFAWAFRLAHYALIMVGSTPIRGTTSEAFAEGTPTTPPALPASPPTMPIPDCAPTTSRWPESAGSSTRWCLSSPPPGWR